MSGGGLYDFRGAPIGKAPPFYGPDGIGRCPIIGQLLCLTEEPAARGTWRIWILPAYWRARPPSKRILGEMVAALDNDLAVAILGSDSNDVAEAAAVVLRLVSGGHA